MNNFGRSLVGVAACAALLSGGAAMAAAPLPAKSLYTCQSEVRSQGKTFVQNTIAAVGACLKGVAGDVINKNVAIRAGTSKTCVNQFRKINDTRGLGKSVQEKLTAKIDAKCLPGNPNVTHTLADITGKAAGLPQQVQTVNIDLWCKHFGGDGSIDTLAEWESCMIGSFNCEAAAAIATQFPRAAEWLNSLLLPANMPAVPAPATDLNKTSDAVTAATNFLALIDPDGDLIPNPRCGGEGVLCSTACCYVENLLFPGGDVTCFEYTAPAAQLNAFILQCPGPSLFGSLVRTPLLGNCAAAPSPMAGLPCNAPPFLVTIQPDATCP